MKVVINACYGGFSISSRAIYELAKLNGKTAYFFKGGLNEPYKEVPLKEAESMWITAFSTNDLSIINNKNKIESFWDEYYLTSRPDDRTDAKLIEVIEKLGDNANGECSKLKVIEIPDGIEYEIDEYDGFEHIAEKHRIWN